MRSKTIITVLGVLILSTFAYLAYKDAVSIWQDLHKQQQQIEELNTQYEELDVELDRTKETKQQNEQELQKLEEEKQELERERQRLERELQAKVESEARVAAATQRSNTAVATTQTVQTTSTTSQGGAMSGCGDNEYAAYIYGQESGGRVTGNCDPSAVNAGGCRGIGQACPGDKLPCGADYACQNQWFTQYAMSRYGSWAAAFNFHKAKGWW